MSSAAGNRLVPALIEGLGFFALAFVGSEALFAPGAESLPLAATVVPGIAAGVGAFAHRMRHPLAEAQVAEDPAPLAGVHAFEPRPAPRAPAARREAA